MVAYVKYCKIFLNAKQINKLVNVFIVVWWRFEKLCFNNQLQFQLQNYPKNRTSIQTNYNIVLVLLRVGTINNNSNA